MNKQMTISLILMPVSVSLVHAEVIPPCGEGQTSLHAAVLCLKYNRPVTPVWRGGEPY